MQRKRNRIAWAVMLVCVMLLAACSSDKEPANSGANETAGAGTDTETTAGTNAGGADDAAAGETFSYKVVGEYQVIPDKNPTMKDQMVMEKFNIKTDTNYITLDQGLEKLNVMFASGNYPDYIPNLNHEAEVKKWGAAGYLVPVSDYMDKLPEYKKQWSDEDWKVVEQFASNPDGKLYYLPAKNYRSHSKAWIYRKDIFDKLGLTFPKTLDELYTVLKTLKAEYPDSAPLSNRGETDLLGVAVNAFRLPGDMFYNFEGFYQDPDQNNEVLYAQATDKYREALKYLNKLYEEDLVEKEFPTMTTEQWTQRGVNNQALIMYDYATRAAYFQNLVTDQSEAQWDWARVAMAAGDQPGFVERELPFFAYGPIVTNKVKDAKLDRILSYFNWAASPEGTKFHTLGVEGETFDMVDGKPKVKFSDKHEMFKNSGFMEFLITDPDYVQSDPDRQTDLAVSAEFADEPYAPFTAFRLTPEEQDLANSKITGITDIAKQFYVKAVMGQVAVNDDAVWSSYLKDLNKAGLEELLTIYKKSVQS